MARSRTRAAAEPVVEEVVETEETTEGGSRKRGPGKLAELHAQWIKDVYDVDIDPEALYLAQSTRKQFREDPESGYAELKAEQEQAAEEKASRRAAKESEVEDEDPAEAAPAPKPRTRSRAKAAPVVEDTEGETPAPAAKPTRSRSRAKAAPVAETTEAAPAPAPATRSRSRKAPF
jgi:ribonuclease E